MATEEALRALRRLALTDHLRELPYAGKLNRTNSHLPGKIMVSHLRTGRALVGLLIAAMSFTVPATAADFAGGGVGAIPDNDVSGINIAFSVSGIVNPVSKVRLRLGITHSFAGDVKATLISPNGIARLVVIGRTGVRQSSTFGSSANFGGTYTFDDAGSDLWVATDGLFSSDVVPSRAYATSTEGTAGTRHGGCSTSLAAAFNGLSGNKVNGTWTLNVSDSSAGDPGMISSALLTILDDQIASDGFERTRGNCTLAQFDFSGTGRTSYALVRNISGQPGAAVTWFIKSNQGAVAGSEQSFVFGNANDFFVPGDFDGDGICDAAVWTAASGKLNVRRSSRPTDQPFTVSFGQAGDDPTQVGDYDGDGFDDFAVFRRGTSSGALSYTLIHLNRSGVERTLVTGDANSFAAGGVDYTGDGRADMAIQSSAGGGVAQFQIFDGSSGALAKTFTFGAPTDSVVVGNYAGGLPYDITTVHSVAANLSWVTYDIANNVGQPSVTWGISSTDYTLGGDYDGDGVDDYAVWRPDATAGQSRFLIRRSSDGGTATMNFGQNGDYPLGHTRVH